MEQAVQGARAERRGTSLQTKAEQREREQGGQGVIWGSDDVMSRAPKLCGF